MTRSALRLHSLLLGLICAALIASPVLAAKRGSLVTQAGTPSIFDNTLRDLLDANIPTANAQSSLLVFTQCYGGDTLDNFVGRAGTTVISATSPGEPAWYGKYDIKAVAKLKPGETSATVHAAGSANAGATPSSTGPVVAIPAIDPAGPVKSRHVLVYAGRPGGGGGTTDAGQRDQVKTNFPAGPNQTVTTVGGPGGGGWDHPGTLAGLTAALKAIKPLMNPDEQFILYVTDHGNLDEDGVGPVTCGGNQCDSTLLELGPDLYLDMLNDPDNDPAVTLFKAGPVDPGPVGISITSEGFLGNTNFQPIDLNDDGDLNDTGEGWAARLEVQEALLDPGGEFVTVQGAPGLLIDEIILESGGIAKLVPAPPVPLLGWPATMLLVVMMLLIGGFGLSRLQRRMTA